MPALANGGYRNHCPACLFSRHVDVRPGDRASGCGALMEPVGLDRHPAKGFMIVHRCLGCGHVRRNRVADGPDDGADDVDALIALMARAGGARAGRPRTGE